VDIMLHNLFAIPLQVTTASVTRFVPKG